VNHISSIGCTTGSRVEYGGRGGWRKRSILPVLNVMQSLKAYNDQRKEEDENCELSGFTQKETLVKKQATSTLSTTACSTGECADVASSVKRARNIFDVIKSKFQKENSTSVISSVNSLPAGKEVHRLCAPWIVLIQLRCWRTPTLWAGHDNRLKRIRH
jgi:hypothetical protein